MIAEPSVGRFVAQAVRDLDGIAEERDVRTLELLVPEALRERLGAEYLRIDLESQPLTVSSPLVEGLAQVLSQAGCVARAYLNPVYLQGGDLQSKWERVFRLTQGRATLVNEALEETVHAVLHFRASFLTDEREERLYPVAVNLTTGTAYGALLEAWPRLFLDEAPGYRELPNKAALEFPALKPAIEAALQSRMAPDVEAARQTQEKFLGRELRRLKDYYGALEAELAERGRRPLSETQAARLAERQRALALDRAKKTRDAIEKHRLGVEAKAVALLRVHQPWLRVAMLLETRGEAIERPFFWNPALKSFAPAACDVCGGATSALALRAAKLLCPSCAAAQ